MVKDSIAARESLTRLRETIEDNYKELKIKIYLWEDFMRLVFGDDEADEFVKAMRTFKEEMHQAIGYQITEILNPHNLSVMRAELDTGLLTFDYDRIRMEKYEKMQASGGRLSYLNNGDYDVVKSQFINGRYKLLLGESDFARSFLTSEWLYKKYFSLEELDNTFIVTGYLKSVEQLLWDVIYILGQGRRIKAKPGRKSKKGQEERSGNSTQQVTIGPDNEDDIDNILGSLECFITDSDNAGLMEPLFDKSGEYVRTYLKSQLAFWRTNQRNGYFHKHNLTNRERIETIRRETYFLYMLILGSLALDDETMAKLG